VADLQGGPRVEKLIMRRTTGPGAARGLFVCKCPKKFPPIPLTKNRRSATEKCFSLVNDTTTCAIAIDGKVAYENIDVRELCRQII
jgi:hypothetical protein